MPAETRAKSGHVSGLDLAANCFDTEVPVEDELTFPEAAVRVWVNYIIIDRKQSELGAPAEGHR